MAAIGGWLRSIGKESNADIIKGIAVRASKDYKNFNQIPQQRLVSLYNAFRNMEKDMNSVAELTEELLLN